MAAQSSPFSLQDRLLRTNHLSGEALDSLFKKQITCLLVEEAVSETLCNHVARNIIDSGRLEGYQAEPSFKKIGAAWFDFGTDEARADHIARTIEYTEATRALCSPYPAPTDILKLDLDLLWKPGAFNMRIGGHPIYFGLPRALPPGGVVEAHFDWIGHDSPGAHGTESVLRQYAVNFYLQAAQQGGELALWETGLCPDELKTLRRADHNYALDETRLGPPTVVISPPAGSLVFFDATQPHAVRKTGGTVPRVTFSSFMGFLGRDRPLLLWS